MSSQINYTKETAASPVKVAQKANAPTSAKLNVLTRRPLLSYIVMSYVFFWLLLTLFAGVTIGLLHLDPNKLSWLLSLIQIAGSWTPALAVAIVVEANEGRTGVKKLFGKMIQFRVAFRWYLIALIPAGAIALAVVAYRLSGGMPVSGVPITPTFWAYLILINLLTGPTAEEPGWRGFALSRLLQRYSPFKSGLIIGILWGFWHLPIWLTTGYEPDQLLAYILAFLISIISLNLLMTWIYLRVQNSLVPMMVAHYANNFCIMLVMPTGLGLGASIPILGWTAAILLIAVLILWTPKHRNIGN